MPPMKTPPGWRPSTNAVVQDQESGYCDAAHGPYSTKTPYNDAWDINNHYQRTQEEGQGTPQHSQLHEFPPMQLRAPHNPRFYTNSRTRLFRQSQLDGPGNIVVFGETGTGKSSLINMLSDTEVTMVSDHAIGCTFESAPYRVSIHGVPYTLWDTAGLNEGHAGSVPADRALHHLRDLVDKLEDGVSLLVYCIRGSRYRDILKVNYDLFTDIICQGEVPVVVVITGLENEERMEGWWDVNAKEFLDRGFRFQGHACVTTSKGKRNMFETEYEESKQTVRTLIKECCPGSAWVVDSDQWFNRITERIQEYWEGYNGYTHRTRGLEGEEEEEEGTQGLFGVAGLFLLGLVQNLSAFCLQNIFH